MDENQNQSIAFFYHNTYFNPTFVSNTSFDENINHTAFSCEEKSNCTSLSIWIMARSCLSMRVKFLVIVASVFLILILFRYCRCCSGSSFLLILFMAYTIPELLVPYSIRLMESANFHNSLFVVWAMFLILALGSASSILAPHPWRQWALQEEKDRAAGSTLLGLLFIAYICW